MSWKPRDGTSRPQIALTGSDRQVEEAEVLDALALAGTANRPPAASLFAGRVVIIGSSAAHAADIHQTAIGEMPGMMVIANAVRSARQNGQVARDGMLLSLFVTAIMSLLTWLVWRLIRRVRLSHLVFKDAAAPIMNLFWLFFISVLLPAAHCEAFLYPQIIVALFLVIIQGLREGHEVSSPAPAEAPQQGDAS
jgi:CHASE2 domain-containing sensor protein